MSSSCDGGITFARLILMAFAASVASNGLSSLDQELCLKENETGTIHYYSYYLPLQVLLTTTATIGELLLCLLVNGVQSHSQT